MNIQKNNYTRYIFLIILGSCFIFLLIAMWHRLSLGIDLTDETYYVTNSYRLLEGNLPIYETWEAQQTGSYLSLPLLFIYKLINGSYDGALLFMRRSYYVFTCLSMLVSYLLLKKVVGKTVALLFSIIPCFLVYCSIPNFSYNTVSIIFVFIGSVAIFSSTINEENQYKKLSVAGFCYALATFTYPSLLILCVVNLLVIFILYNNTYKSYKYLKAILYYAVSGILTAFIIISSLIINLGGISKLIKGVDNILKSPYFHLPNKVDNLFQTVFLSPIKDYLMRNQFKLMLLTLVIIVLLCTFGLNYYKKIVVFLPIVLGLSFIIYIKKYIHNTSVFNFLLVNILFYTLCIQIFLRNKKKILTTFLSLELPAILLMVIRSLTSNNYNVFIQTISLMPIIIAFGIVLNEIMIENLDKLYLSKLINLFAMGFLSLSISVAFVYSFYDFVYRDNSIQELTVKMDNTLYKGIYTTPERKIALEQLQQEILLNSNPQKTIMVANHFVPAYIMSGMKPMTPDVWDSMYIKYGIKEMESVERYFKVVKSTPDIVFIVLFEENSYDIHDKSIEFNSFLSENYAITYSSPCSSFYRLIVYHKK